MIRSLVLALFMAGSALAQDGILRGTLKKVDADKLIVTITLDGKDKDYRIGENTRVFGNEGKPLKEKLTGLKEGSPVMFKPDKDDVLIGLRAADAKEPKQKLAKVDTSKLKPLTELGSEEYQGFQGGLYPDSKNERPADHEKAGLAIAKTIRPLDADGKPSDSGKIVLLSVGMSNTSQSSEGFSRALRGVDTNTALVFVNGAQGRMTAKAIQDPDDKGSGTRYWTTSDDRLKKVGLTPAQVQVIWIKQADAGPSSGFPKYAQTLQAELKKIVQVIAKRYPNTKLCYLSSRTYGGYAKTPLNPEPYAYESGFSVKWLIEEQIKGDRDLNYDPAKGAVKSPWLSWGSYLWANGMTKRGDGFCYEEADFNPNDGTHQSQSGQAKIGKELLKFFQTDSTTKTWFNK